MIWNKKNKFVLPGLIVHTNTQKTVKMRVDEFNQGIEEVQIEFFKRGGDSVFGQDEKRTRASIVAAVINNNFLESEYQGKDWEAVRKTLIKQLS